MDFIEFERNKQTNLYIILAKAIEALKENGLTHDKILELLDIDQETFVDICEYL